MDNPSALGGGVADRVTAEILDMIARGDLTPGERLPGERQLAERMGVSRVSVRAALQRLKAQGFLASVQGGGTRVVSSAAAMDGALTALVRSKLDNLHDLAEIRVTLESWAARRAAERATPGQVAEIAARLDAMAAAGPRQAVAGGTQPDKALEDVAFHFAIGKAAGSPVYTHILSVIRDILTQMLEFHRYELFLAEDDDRTVLEHHRAIYQAIAARDAPGADAAMRRHLEWVLRHYDEAARRAIPAAGRQAPR
ncbi:MAG TPA: FCD domain-containing protein [Alphaproteobacteria bacterium]|nr:FCD domain-containing protein [Alphaproteobacteria bacterium]